MVPNHGRFLPLWSQVPVSKQPPRVLRKSTFLPVSHEARIHMPTLLMAFMRTMMSEMPVIMLSSTLVRHQCHLVLAQCRPLLVRFVLRLVKQVFPMAAIIMVKTWMSHLGKTLSLGSSLVGARRRCLGFVFLSPSAWISFVRCFLFSRQLWFSCVIEPFRALFHAMVFPFKHSLCPFIYTHIELA
ncbi:hypothetical protein P691DRAFT_318419 [Macrolepiota fuliginosa MF-IS2]|uniref:Uncharacterized protein n=1 Tax=Macrolepiota fuliginosa MF-IS2 TaxID=1400762 RepID=A0A9P5XQ38_9AGAR|nr:hypothetical protein P691DRAFT_318419 [Macrolepiota fuliginosa MF-IS2]